MNAREPLVIELPIARVVVFEDRARITRQGTIPTTAPETGQGASTLSLRLPGVPAVLVDSSLSVRATGARVLASRVERRHVARIENSSQSLAELELQLQRTALDLAELDGRIVLVRRTLNDLSSLSQRALQEAAEDVSFGGSVALALAAELLTKDERWLQLSGELHEHQARREELARQKQDIEGQLRALYRPEHDLAAELVLGLQIHTASALSLYVEYTVPCACWRPRHRIDLLAPRTATSGRAPLRVETAATVWQNTGEDWRDVALAFSTSRPSLGATPPVLSSDHLRTRQRKETLAVEAREAAIMTTGVAAAPPGSEAPGIDDGGSVLLSQAPRRETVSSNGRAHRVELRTWEAEAELSAVAAPELSAAVIARSVQQNRGVVPLLAGPCELLRDGGLIGRTSLDFVAPGASFELGWGSDPQIYVHRSKIQHDTPAALLGSWHVTRYGVEIRLHNLGPETKQFSVKERIPVSEIEKVKIELLRDGTEPRQKPDDNGILTWSVTLSAFEMKRIRLSYEVKRHSDVSGLEL